MYLQAVESDWGDVFCFREDGWEGISDKVTFEQKPKQSMGVSSAGIWGRVFRQKAQQMQRP